MKATVFFFLAILGSLLPLAGCDDSEINLASIVGVWTGTQLDYIVTPNDVPFPMEESDENYDAVVEFKEDGTLIYTDDGETRMGTYEVVKDKLNTTLTFHTQVPISPGTFTINQLNSSKLKLSITEEGEIEVPDYGVVQGTLRATLFFEKDQD